MLNSTSQFDKVTMKGRAQDIALQMLQNMTPETVQKVEERLARKKGAMPPVNKYPKDAELVKGILNLYEGKSGEFMPENVRQHCLVLAAAFSKAVPHFDAYQLYQESVTVTKQDLAIAYGAASWDQLPKEMKGKLERALTKATKIWLDRLTELETFINEQASHEETWTPEEASLVTMMEDVVLDVELDPADIGTYIIAAATPDPKYFMRTGDIARYLITMSKGVIQHFPLELDRILKKEGFLKGDKGWYVIITQHV